MERVADRLAAYQEAFNASASQIGAARRTLSPAGALAIVRAEYSGRGVPIPDAAARTIARKLLWHPLWSVVRPVWTRNDRP